MATGRSRQDGQLGVGFEKGIRGRELVQRKAVKTSKGDGDGAEMSKLVLTEPQLLILNAVKVFVLENWEGAVRTVSLCLSFHVERLLST